MTCRGCNKSSNFVFMTGIPEEGPMFKYVDFIRETEEDPVFGPDDLEVQSLVHKLNISIILKDYRFFT